MKTTSLGDLREFSIPLIQIENDHRIAALPEIFKRGAINQQQVHVLIVVVIKKRRAATRNRQKKVLLRSTGNRQLGYARLRGHVNQTHRHVALSRRFPP